MTTEAILIEQLKHGDETAFKELIDQWKDMVYNTALGIVQNETEAEDLTQDVFIKVYEKISSFKGDSKLSTWIYRITVTTALDFLRRQKRKKRWGTLQSVFREGEGEPPPIADFHHPGVALDNKERSAILFGAIGRLPENQKAAYVLHKLEGLSYKEISEVLKTSVSAVESLMSRATGNLKKYLEDYYEKNYK